MASLDRGAEAVFVVLAAIESSPEAMKVRGWHRASGILPLHQATAEVADHLGDPDYRVAVTKTCSGYIVWTALR